MLVLLAYLAVGLFVGGFAWKIWLYSRAPAPLKIPGTPAPVTKLGVVWRLFTEVAFFNSLFKGNKWTWVGGYAFHLALVVVLIRHIRYFCDPLPPYFHYVEIFGILAGIAMVGALGFLLVRRYWVARTRYISSLADYLMLLWLIGIGISGLLMDFVTRPDIISIKKEMTALVSLHSFTIPDDRMFQIHFFLVLVLVAIFPFSKLMHLGGIFFSPTRNQVDNPRERRHINPWADTP